MVTTTSAAWTNSSVRGLGNSRDRSMLHSAMAAATAGLRRSAGADPAERTWTRPLAWWSRRAAAIWLRPALWTQTNRTSGVSAAAASFGSVGEAHLSTRLTVVDTAWHPPTSTAIDVGAAMPTPTTTTVLPLASACCAPLGAVGLSDDQAQATAMVFKAL